MRDLNYPLWVITSYYNPAGYKKRFENFCAFRRNLGVPLMVVELSKSGEFQLSSTDADIVIQLVGEDAIWQKERLINIGISKLPKHVRYVAWADCDIIWEDVNWANKAMAKLDANGGGLLQPFRINYYLPNELITSDVDAIKCRTVKPMFSSASIAKAIRNDEFYDNEIKIVQARSTGNFTNYHNGLYQYNAYGMAWVALRSQLELCGLHDVNIIGGGDSAQVFSLLGNLNKFFELRAVSAAHKQTIEDWAQRATDAGLLSKLDDLDGAIYHLWHGQMSDRNYRGRHKILAEYGFDPNRDIRLASNRTWEWSDPQGTLASDLRKYFFLRKEDG